MDSPVIIIEVLSDGKYNLKEEVLSSIVSSANECQSLAVISIIGWNQREKEFVFNCLTNYLSQDSHNRDVWPDNSHILDNVWDQKEQLKTSSVRMWSKPFILKVDDESIAVFLMDSTLTFGKQNAINYFSEDIVDLFCGTSSTIIYLKVQKFIEKDLEVLKNAVEKSYHKNLTTNSFKELIYLILNWDPNNEEYKDKNYLFGSKGGDNYMSKEFSVDVNRFFTQTKCYLLPSIGTDISDKELNFNDINSNFVEEFSQFIKSKLSAIYEIQDQRSRYSNNSLKSEQLVTLFRDSVNQSNERINGRPEELRNREITQSNNKQLKPIIKRPISNRTSESFVMVGEEDFDTEIREESEEQNVTAQSNAVSKEMAEKTTEKDHIFINKGSSDGSELSQRQKPFETDRNVCKQLEINVSQSNCHKDIEDHKYRNELNETTCQGKTNKMEVLKDGLIELYKKKMKEITFEKKFNSLQDFKSLLEEKKTKMLKKFDSQFNIKEFTDSNRKTIKGELRRELNQINEELKSDFKFLMNFEKYFNLSIPKFDETMKALIESKLQKQQNIIEFKITEENLNQFLIQSKNNIFESMKTNYGISDDTNHRINAKFHKLIHQILSSRLENYQNTLHEVLKYLHDWNNDLNGRGYFENIETHNKTLTQRRLSFWKFYNSDVKDYSKKLFETIFMKIKSINEKKKCEIRSKYEDLISEGVKGYENQLRQRIEEFDGFHINFVGFGDRIMKLLLVILEERPKNLINRIHF